MKPPNSMLGITLLSLFIIGGIHDKPQAQTAAQGAAPITVYQYRRVAGDKREEFIKRETTYWSEVARKALAKGNLTFWALLEKVGGYDLENSSNFLFINTFKDIDAVGDVFGSASVTASFPSIPMAKMETNSLSTVTSMFFLRAEDWQQSGTAVPDKDFKYVSMVYHNASNPAALIAMEKKHWAPFIKSAMDKKQVTQVAWGNATVLSPLGGDVEFNTVSYDLYPSLREALNPTWDQELVIPTEGLMEIGKLETNSRGGVVYQVVKAISPQ